MNYENNKKELIKAIVVTVATLVIYKISYILYIGSIEDNIIQKFVGEVVLVTLTVLTAIYLKKISALKPSFKGFGKGLLLGLPMILAGAYLLVAWLGQYSIGNVSVDTSCGMVVLLAVTCIMVGISEELLLRGVLLERFADYYGRKDAKSWFKATIFSSLVFGAFHMLNMINGVSFTGALIQAAGASLSGVFLAAVYIRSGRKLWPCIIIHAIWDFIGFICGGSLNGASTGDTLNRITLGALIPSAIFAICGFIQLRKKKLNEAVEKNEA